MPRNLDHILLSGYASSSLYTSPNTGRDRVVATPRNRNSHGNSIKNQLESAVNSFKDNIDSDSVYLEFVSEKDCLLAFDSFEDGRRHDFKFMSSKLEKIIIDGEEHLKYRACVHLNTNGISKFLKKIEEYLDESKNTPNGYPRNQKLINNVETIRRATLESFWQELELEFPDYNTEVWWEIWLRRDNYQEDITEDLETINQLLESNISVAERRLVFPEHIVRMVRSTAEELSTTLLYSDRLAELRKPKEAADFFTSLNNNDASDWVEDLKNRTINRTSQESVIICLLDTGVNRGHPLLEEFLPERNMDSVKPEWGTADTHRFGHGTEMAGISLYGDLTEILQDDSTIEIYHFLESVKLIHPNNPHLPELYGAVTIEAVSRAITLNNQNIRVYSMAITSTDGRDRGRPSSWSSSVDNICFGDNGISNDKSLFCISGGNVLINNESDFPNNNFNSSIHDPAQAFNALTVGSFTIKTFIDQIQFPNAIPLVNNGGMSPSNSTSVSWENIWAIKPEIVLEGGNLGVHNNGLISPDSLRILTTGKNFRTEPLVSSGDTSAASALASKFASQLLTEYKSLWPETIKALMVHSAEWTNEMLENSNLSDLSKAQKISLMRSVGYGVPNYQKAIKSANNSLTLISQEIITPYRIHDGRVKTNDMHFFELPWPREVLTSLFDNEVTLTVTLSYFIQPNPGAKLYSKSYSYQSHGLRFKMINSGETIEHFRERVNREAREEEGGSYGGESWLIGSQVRNKGSIHKDIWKGTGADLATKSTIAVYPVNGWWRTRKALQQFNNSARYSLIVSIDSSNNDIDLYTPVLNMIDIVI